MQALYFQCLLNSIKDKKAHTPNPTEKKKKKKQGGSLFFQ